MGEKAGSVGALAGVAALMGVCCGVPLLISIGAVGALAGIGLGSWIIICVAAIAVIVGVIRWHRSSSSCDMATTDDATARTEPAASSQRRRG